MGDAYTESKRIARQWEDAKWYCQRYFGEVEMPSHLSKEIIKERIYTEFGQRTPEELAREISYKI